MKKQKFMKLTAFTSSPSLENSFSAPATHDGEVSVVFSGKNVKIHGWDGSVWSVIYTWDGVDKEHTFDNTFDNYFLESLTGQEETISVSFFSVDRYQGSTPSLAGVTREVKLYDVDEVPIYTAADYGKMLTIMSDGSLRWLGASATWMIDGSPVPESGGDYIEDRNDLILGAGATVVDSVANIGSDYSASLQVGGAGAAGPFRSLLETYAYSISFFMKTVKTSDMVLVADHWRGTSNGFFVQYGADGVFAFIKGNGPGAVYSSTSTQVLRDGNWHHVTLTVNPDTTHKIYIDGYEFCSVSVGGNAPFHASSTLSFGWLEKGPHAQDDGRTVDGQMNQIEIHDSTLSAAEVLANYNSELTPTEYIEDRNDLILGAGTTIVDSVVNVGNDVTSSLQVGGVGVNGPFRSLFETYEFSVSFWMKTTNPGNAMLVTDCWAGTFNGWFVYLSSTGHLQFVNGGGGGELSSPTTANQLRDGNWHHVVCTVAPDSTNKVYIDGVEFCSINLGGNRPFHASSALTFGWIGQGQVGPFGGYPLDGQMDQIQIHDSTLSAAAALDLYNEGR